MKTEKTIGYLLIIGALGVFIPYSILTITFDYPDILRLESGEILTRFHQGGSSLIFTWLAFALLGFPLLIAYSMIGKHLSVQRPYFGWVTTLGIISGIAQIIGLLRWVFVVPVLANEYVHTDNPATQEALRISFKVVHQFGGVLLGEHLGQLLTVVWTIFTAFAFYKTTLIPKWLFWFGTITSVIYLLAQTELLATVLPAFPTVDLAGLVGSTGWLVWLVLVGIRFVKDKSTKK